MSDFNIDMTGKDYLSLVTLASSYAAELLPEWTSRDDNDINWVTIKTIAYLISIGMFYIDLSFNEKDPVEVKIYKNALKLALSYGMPVRKYCGAVVDVSVTVATHTTQLTFTRGTNFTAGNLNFVLVEPTVMIASVTIATFGLQYGTASRMYLGVSDGTPYQKFIIDDATVQNDSVKLFINESGLGEVEWERVDSLVMGYETDKIYRMDLNEDEKYVVNFGDDHCGKIPLATSPIYADVILMPTNYETDKYGNIAQGNITASSDARVTLITQSDAAVGGGAKETLEEIGINLPQWVATANRAVTVKDYEYLARRVAGVGYVRATQVDLLVSLYVIPTGGGSITPALKTKIEDYIGARKMDQITVEVIDPVDIAVNTEINIGITETRNQSEIADNVRTAVEDYLNRPISVGVDLTILDLYDTLKGVEGVTSAQVLSLYREGQAITLGDLAMDVNETTVAGTLITINPTGGII